MNHGDSERSLWVTAALNAKPQDRRMTRAELNPVQHLRGERMQALSTFDAVGELGVSALAQLPDGDLLLSTGQTLHRYTPGSPSRPVAVAGLADMHEIHCLGDRLWIANTGADEAIELDASDLRVRSRLSLHGFREGRASTAEAADRFHCNQIFEGLDGGLHALVHHVSGFQTLHKIAERLVKSHGHGGVLDLRTGTSRALGLKAPHSVRVVQDRYYVCDSGACRVRVYDRDWRELHSWPTRGFGRGAAWCSATGTYYVGISSTRARYLGIQPGPGDCRLQGFDVQDGQLKREISIPNAEQISNLYLMPPRLLHEFGERRA